jgi:hypothetical protein
MSTLVLKLWHYFAALATARSSGVMPFSLFFSLFVLWFLISVPLSVLGGYTAFLASNVGETQRGKLWVNSQQQQRDSEHGQEEYEQIDEADGAAAVETWGDVHADRGERGTRFERNGGDRQLRSNQIPRQIPESKLPATWIALAAGVFPFGTAFVEIYYIMTSLWLHQTYYVFGFLLVVFLLTTVIIAEISIVLTYFFLCNEDYRWWWRSICAGGSTALYLLVYAALYVGTGLLDISSGVGLVVYAGRGPCDHPSRLSLVKSRQVSIFYCHRRLPHEHLTKFAARTCC